MTTRASMSLSTDVQVLPRQQQQAGSPLYGTHAPHEILQKMDISEQMLKAASLKTIAGGFMFTILAFVVIDAFEDAYLQLVTAIIPSDFTPLQKALTRIAFAVIVLIIIIFIASLFVRAVSEEEKATRVAQLKRETLSKPPLPSPPFITKVCRRFCLQKIPLDKDSDDETEDLEETEEEPEQIVAVDAKRTKAPTPTMVLTRAAIKKAQAQAQEQSNYTSITITQPTVAPAQVRMTNLDIQSRLKVLNANAIPS